MLFHRHRMKYEHAHLYYFIFLNYLMLECQILLQKCIKHSSAARALQKLQFALLLLQSTEE